MVDVTGERTPSGLSEPALRLVSKPLEAVIYPGDVLYFPKKWAHHTEALPALPDNVEHSNTPLVAQSPSVSLGFRTDGRFLL
mgnify:CR=1 FL=1